MSDMVNTIIGGTIVLIIGGVAGMAWKEPALFRRFSPYIYAPIATALVAAILWNVAILEADVAVSSTLANEAASKALQAVYIPKAIFAILIFLLNYCFVAEMASYIVSKHRAAQS